MTNTKQWLEKLGDTIDAKDADGFVSYMTEDGIFRFANQPDVVGRQAIRDYVAAFFTMHNGSKHEIVNFWDHGDSIIWQGRVTYTRMDKKQVNVNFTNIFYMSGGLIREYLIYIDNTPLFAE